MDGGSAGVDEVTEEHDEGIRPQTVAFPESNLGEASVKRRARTGRGTVADMTASSPPSQPAHPGCPAWTRRRDALRLFLSGVTVRAAGPVALVVGTLLSAVNQGGVLLNGDLTVGVGVKVGVNYLTPFVVTSLGFLAAGRQPVR